MKQAYPIVMTKDGAYFVVAVPDLEINTQGETIAEAMEMARDAIGMFGCYKQDEKQTIAPPSKIDAIKARKTDIVTLVDVDFDTYRKKHETRTVRKNLTIPSWLNSEAEKAGINFSSVLQNALIQQLHITE